MKNTKQILEDLIHLLINYEKTHRKSTLNFKVDYFTRHTNKRRDQVDFDDESVRENLIEHVGYLPIVATYLHQYIDAKINLGLALTMLSIHDIGETVTGDTLFFDKKDEDETEEINEALKLLPKNLHSIYLEFENPTTQTGKYAKSIDKLAPDIIESYHYPEIANRRFEAQGFDIDTIVNRKKEFMAWSPFMLNFFEAVIIRMRENLC